MPIAANFIPGGEETMLRGRRALNDFLNMALGGTVSGSHHIANEELIFQTPDQVILHCYMYSWQRFTGFPVPRTVIAGAATRTGSCARPTAGGWTD
jgi:hypothetical protein